MDKIDRYFGKTRKRANRRKSSLNLLFIPLAILCIGGVYFLFWKGATSLQKSFIPADAIFSSYTRIGSVMMYIPLLFPSFFLGMMFANLIVWPIAPLRKVFDREARGFKKASFKSSVKFLLVPGLVMMLIALPISFLGSHNYFYINQNGVAKNFFFGNRQYLWDDIVRVSIGCFTRRQRTCRVLRLNYKLIFNDGTKIDLWEDNPVKFLNVYDRIFAFLQKTPPKIIYEQRITTQGLRKLKNRFSPAIQAKIQKILRREFIGDAGQFLVDTSKEERKRGGDKNLKTCESLNSFISKDELIKKMGQPFKEEVADRGTVLYYESNAFASGPVRVLVNNRTDGVIGKKCFEDDEWVYFKDLE